MGGIFYDLETAFVLLVMFTILVAAHEYGHYLFARLFNMGVEEFAIGFGKRPVFEWMHRTYQVPLRAGEVPEISRLGGGKFDLESTGSRPREDIQEIDTPSGKALREVTRFTVRPWPLGGFVRIKGMMPEEDGSETTIAGGFYNKPPWQRLLVLFAGPMFSVLAGLAILIPYYLICGDEKLDNRPIFGVIMDKGPAYEAGIQEGDFVTSIQGQAVHTFYDINKIVRDSQGKTLDISVLRDGHPLLLRATPELDEKPSTVFGPNLEDTHVKRPQAKLKTGFAYQTVKVNLGQAIVLAVSTPVEAVMGLVDAVRTPSTLKDSVGGPISITAVTYATVREGLAPVFRLAALLSISVGIMNLLPVMPLDGGQMTLALAEMFRRGKRLSAQVQSLVGAAGLAFMLCLIVGVFYVDIRRMTDAHSESKAAKPVPKATK